MSICIPNPLLTFVPAATNKIAASVSGLSAGIFRLPGEYSGVVGIELTGLKSGTEVRVFQQGTTTEISGTGAENITSGSHTFNIGRNQPVDISILCLGYQNMRLLNFSSSVNAVVPVVQFIDRQYHNP